jgi:hypothetical protein
MSVLIILGNTNIYSFTNTITIANTRARSILGEDLRRIFIIHTYASQKALQTNDDWKKHLKIQGIEASIVETVIELDVTEESVEKFVEFLSLAIQSAIDSSKVIVDLTNGTIQYKNLLSTAAYVLDIKHQYLFDTARLRILTKGDDKFFASGELDDYYVATPKSSQLDNIAYLNLTEVIRYKKVVSDIVKEFNNVGKGDGDAAFLYDNSLYALRFKLEGDRHRDNALYRISASSLSASLEEVISASHQCLPANSKSKKKYLTFGDQLEDITIYIKSRSDVREHFDSVFHDNFCKFALYLRNSTTHKGKVLTVSQKYKSELAVKTAVIFIDYYINEVWPLIVDTSPKDARLIYQEISDPDAGEQFYFGLDGDNTGKILEQLFREDGSSDEMFRRVSETVARAISSIEQTIKFRSKDAVVIFAAGDDVLFKSRYDQQLLHDIQAQYGTITGTLMSDLRILNIPTPTCSIGYGRSLKEVFLALKLAKSKLGKHSIVGIEYNRR